MAIPLWKNEKFNLTEKNSVKLNQVFSNLVSKTITFTKFLPKKSEMRVNIHNFDTVKHRLKEEFSAICMHILSKFCEKQTLPTVHLFLINVQEQI